MSRYREGQVGQLADALEVAGWTAEDVTHLGQAGKARLEEIRLSLSKSDIIAAIEAGKTELWLHDDQKTSWVQGRKILTHLYDTGLLASCADLDELKAVQAKGIKFFRQHGFSGKAIFGWRGVQDGRVPCLIGSGGEVVLNWNHLDNNWNANNPALRRNSFHFSPDFLSGEFCFIICPCQPPSCLPAFASGSDNIMYFLVSNALISHSIYKRNFKVSSEIMAFLTNGCFSCFSKKLATKMLSIVCIKYLSMVSTKVYREVFGIVGI